MVERLAYIARNNMLLAWLVVLVFATFCFLAAAARASDYNPTEAYTQVFCKTPERIAHHYTGTPAMLARDPDCMVLPYPQAVRGLTIHTGPLTDWEGDKFYVAEWRMMYFAIWPHLTPARTY